MQFFGACSKLSQMFTIYAINGGIDEKTKVQVGPEYNYHAFIFRL